MPSVIRSILGVIGGLILAFLVTFVVEAVAHHLYPLPPGVGPHDLESMRAAMAGIPMGALVLVLAGWTLGSFLGGWLAAVIAGQAHAAHGTIVGGILMLMALVNMVMIPHPVWLWVASFLLIVPAAFLGGRMAAMRRSTV